jgi:hypothetical protein
LTEVAKKAKLVVDANGVAIQSPLHLFPTVTVLNVAATNVNGTALTGIEIVRLCASEACVVKFGRDNSITAVDGTDTYLPANTPEYFSLRGDTYIACVKLVAGAGAGKLYITPME